MNVVSLFLSLTFFSFFGSFDPFWDEICYFVSPIYLITVDGREH